MHARCVVLTESIAYPAQPLRHTAAPAQHQPAHLLHIRRQARKVLAQRIEGGVGVLGEVGAQ